MTLTATSGKLSPFRSPTAKPIGVPPGSPVLFTPSTWISVSGSAGPKFPLLSGCVPSFAEPSTKPLVLMSNPLLVSVMMSRAPSPLTSASTLVEPYVPVGSPDQPSYGVG